MREKFQYDQPPKICPDCGKEIPVNGYEYDERGMVARDERGNAIFRKYASLICETCARNATPPPPPRQRGLRRGETHPDQAVIDAPAIRID